MKRLRIISIFIIAIICTLTSSMTLAYNDYCEFTEDGHHDFTCISDKENAHPHKGYRECYCGKRVYYDNSYFDECIKCRKELCNEGVHYYLADIYYIDLFSGYGECYCGKRKKFFSYNGGKNWYEPYPGIINPFNDSTVELFVEAKHPHREYDPYSGLIDFSADQGWHIGECGVCELQDDYYREVEEYEIDTILYKNDKKYYEETNSIYEYEENYYNEDESYENESYLYDDFSEYEENDEFYEWLELVKEILDE